jgi:hypothetical protein
MKHRLLVMVPLALTLALFVTASLLPDASSRGALLRGAVHAAKLLGFLGALAAALAFERGDYLRRAWGLQALYMLLLARELPLGGVPLGTSILGVRVEVLNEGVVIAANVSGVCATWLMARAWSVAGLGPPGSRARRVAIVAAVLFVVLPITGVPLARDVLAWIRGTPTPLIPVISGAADTTSMCLIAPVLLTVLGMRGGLLVWPWGLFTASLACWLLYDAGEILYLMESLSAHAPDIQVAKDCARVLACGFACTAGLAQRMTVLTASAPHCRSASAHNRSRS